MLKHTQQSERLRNCNLVKEQLPETAQMLLDLNRVMGKPEAVVITIDDKLIMQSGEFQGIRDMTVPKSRGRW